MHSAIGVDESGSIDVRIAQIRAELNLHVAKLELRMTKMMFVGAIFAFALVVLLVLPTLNGLALALFLGGSAGQAYAVWRM
jgi:hypothetical protein